MLSRSLLPALAIAALIVTSNSCFAQNYPVKPIRFVTSGVSGAPDYAARVLAQELTNTMGQSVIVDNRGSGTISEQIVSQATPDGYTLLVAATNHWTTPLLEKTSYDPIKDFAPISLLSKAPLILVVYPSLPIKTVKDLIDMAKAKPGVLNYASAVTGSPTHLAAELFKFMAHVSIVRVPYKSGAAMSTDLIGGHVQLSFGNSANMIPHVNSGRLRGIAVTSAQPSAVLPGLPTVAESGLPGYESDVKVAMFGPAKISASLVSRLNRESVQALSRADVKERFAAAAFETIGSSPAQLETIVKAEMAMMGKVIKEAGIHAD